ncbi:MAG: hypothetical protein WBB18_14630 [Nodosilinea sp.]
MSHYSLAYFLPKNERQVTHFNEVGEYDGEIMPGDFYLCPIGHAGFTHWQSVDKTLHIIIELGVAAVLGSILLGQKT